MKRIDEANAEAHRRILAAEPVLADVRLARDVLPRLGDRTVLHAGPPITWERMCGPMRGAVAGAIVFEGWAKDLEAAMALAASGAIAFEPNHHHDAVGPMTGMTTRGMAVLVVENRAFGNRAFCTVNEGLGNLADTCEHDLGRILRFVAGNDMFFLNVAMALAKAAVAPAHGIAHSTVVTTMARNGTDFGIRVSGTGDRWFTGPAQMARGLLFAGYSDADANQDIGDSCITETVGLGGFAMAAAPAVVGFLGAGRLADAIAHTRRMAEITLGPNPAWRLPTLDMDGVPVGIDIRKVLSTGVLPVINTAIANRLPGRGQIGAGVVHPPMACFEQALVAFAELNGVA